jgi:nucleotide-binding universal stress UspA family protein
MAFLITRILLATDFSTSATRALRYALVLAQSWVAELHVLHVLEWFPGMDPEHAVNRMNLSERRKEADQQFLRIKDQATASDVSLHLKRRSIVVNTAKLLKLWT